MSLNAPNTPSRRLPGWLTPLSLGFCAEGVVRYLYSGVFAAMRNGYWAVIRRQLSPLLEFLWRGQPIAATMASFDPEQARYGPVTFLVAHPLALFTGSPRAMELTLLAFGHVCFWITVFLIDRRFFSRTAWQVRVLFLGLALNFTPILITMGEKAWNLLELVLVTTGLYLATSSSPRLRRLASVPVAAGVLTRLTPALVMVSLAVRHRVSAVVGLATGAVILTVSHILYGAPMGWGYLARLPGIVGFTQHVGASWTNNSLKGLVYKFINGFHYDEALLNAPMVVDPSHAAVADGILLVFTFVALAFAIIYLWRWRAGPDPELERLRTLGAFSLGVVLIMLISPFAAMPYMCSFILAFALLLRAWELGLLHRSEIVMGLIALVLIGNMLPFTAVVWLSGAPWLNRVRHSAPSLAFNETFEFYGWPGYGVILLTVTLMRLQWRLTRSTVALDRLAP